MEKRNIILDKLDGFIRKYYRNKLIRGSLWTLAILGGAYIILVLPEYFFWFNAPVRAIAFFSFLGLAGFLSVRLILIPFLQLKKIGTNISYEQAAILIGEHFPEISDKLLNTLQLMNHQYPEHESLSLLQAGIEQKTGTLKLFSFTKVVDLRKNLKYARIAAIPVVTILLLAFAFPDTISGPTRRIVQFDSVFNEELPYRLKILNKELNAIQQEDFELSVLLTGSEIPRDIYIEAGKSTFKMMNGGNFIYSYRFKSVQNDIAFRIIAGDLTSGPYTLNVVPRPVIHSFEVTLNYPLYTNKPSENIENQGDLTIPEGTRISWKFFTKDVDSLILLFDSIRFPLIRKSGIEYTGERIISQPSNYTILPSNRKAGIFDSIAYRINVITDGYPSVFVHETTDSVMDGVLFFKGTIKDDYGFSDLSFNYSLKERGGDTSSVKSGRMIIPIDKSVNNQVFYFSEQLGKLITTPGQSIYYWFEIRDNDGIHGPKVTRSEVRVIKSLTIDEIADKTDLNENRMEADMESSLDKAEEIKRNIDELNKKLIENKSVTWQEKKKLEDLLKENREIEKKIDETRKRNSENIRNEKDYLETSERILDKQEQLNELLDQLMSEELKKMLEEMQKMMDQLDKEKISDMLEKMKLSTRDLEKQLDRSLELMKQIEFDRKLEETVNELRKTAEEQKELAKRSEQQEESLDKLTSMQEQLNNRSDSLMKKIQDLESEGKKLEEPADLGNTKEKRENIGKNQKEGLNSLKQNKKKDASGKQNKAAEEMNELADQMESSRQEEEGEQLEEDAENLRKILEDLVRLSFTQEDLINRFKTIGRNDPRYPELMYKQQEFGEKMEIVEDSLDAIAKRQIMIQPVISREMVLINQNIALTIEALEEKNTALAVAKQQYTMTSVNNLALLLNESMEKMNQQSQSMNSKSGSKSCSNPSSGKGGKMSAKSLKQLQEQLGKQLEKMKAGMEEAKKGSKQSRESGMGMNRELAKLAAQQEALRNSLKKYQEELGGKGIKDQTGLNEAARTMEQIERDIVNKQITQETIRRQQQIMTRLLESEKAEQTRDQEKERESREAKELKISNPAANFQYNTKKRGGVDDIQLTLPTMTTFYKDKVNSYIVKIGF